MLAFAVNVTTRLLETSEPNRSSLPPGLTNNGEYASPTTRSFWNIWVGVMRACVSVGVVSVTFMFDFCQDFCTGIFAAYIFNAEAISCVLSLGVIGLPVCSRMGLKAGVAYGPGCRFSASCKAGFGCNAAFWAKAG